MSPLWTYRLPATPGGVVLARESGHVLTWDLNRWLVLLGRHGKLQAQTRLEAGLVAAALTGQSLPAVPTPEPCRFVAATYAGDRFLVGGVFGGVHLLAADGSVLAAEKMGQPVGGLALAPRGDSAVVALADGRVVALALP